MEVVPYRSTDEAVAAIVLVHGFRESHDYWQSLHEQLSGHDLAAWDVQSFGYPSQWLPRRKGYRFSLNPSLAKAAELFATACNTSLARYKKLALVTHSSGGMVAMRAIIDDAGVRRRISHLVLAGTALGGIRGLGRWFGFINPQLHAMRRRSPFFRSLHADWERVVGDDPPFVIRAVAALEDEHMTVESAHGWFPEQMQETVVGGHNSMIEVHHASAPIVQLIVKLLPRRAEVDADEQRVFMSYVREDGDTVQRVFRALQERRLGPWMDTRRLAAGEEWQHEINAALRRSERFLVFLSASALEAFAQRDVFYEEVAAAVAIQESLPDGTPFLVPVLLYDSDPPALLKKYQWYRFGDDVGIGSLVDGLAASMIH